MIVICIVALALVAVLAVSSAAMAIAALRVSGVYVVESRARADALEREAEETRDPLGTERKKKKLAESFATTIADIDKIASEFGMAAAAAEEEYIMPPPEHESEPAPVTVPVPAESNPSA